MLFKQSWFHEKKRNTRYWMNLKNSKRLSFTYKYPWTVFFSSDRSSSHYNALQRWSLLNITNIITTCGSLPPSGSLPPRGDRELPKWKKGEAPNPILIFGINIPEWQKRGSIASSWRSGQPQAKWWLEHRRLHGKPGKWNQQFSKLTFQFFLLFSFDR